MMSIFKLYNGREHMRLFGLIAIAVSAAPLCAPADMPKGLFRGKLVSWEGSPSKGILLARNSAGTVEGCGYDALSYLELSRRRITVAKLEPGDPIEIVTDHKPGSRDCYIRMLQVIPPGPPPSRVNAVAKRPAIELPRGDRTISGVIIRRDIRSITLRTRDGEQTLLLRRDTRYLDDGAQQDAGALVVNTRVFVRAGQDLEGGVEAYQVMWGDIAGVQ
ncbi:MAG: hypothetical protein JWO19_1154 [Bryobacterales bacterium]|jgi:hypothetical protein|nr:hypothetical protein [Bryobacterales bacterium]